MNPLILVYFYTICAFFSFIGSLTLIYFYYKSRGSKTPSQQFIFRMGVCDAIYSISQFIVIYPRYRPLKIRCPIQAFLEQSSSMCVFISCFLLSLLSYRSISSSTTDIRQITKRSFIFTVAISIILALIPIIKLQTQSSEYDCMFAGQTNSEGNLEVIFIFYLPLLFCLTASLFYDIRSLTHIRKLKQINGETLEIQAAEEIVSNMFMYPIIFGICWGGGILQRFSELFWVESSKFFNIGIIICFNNLQGFLNSIVYVYNLWKQKKLMGLNGFFFISNLDSSYLTSSILSEQFLFERSTLILNESQELSTQTPKVQTYQRSTQQIE